nr:kazrin isoform X1 [Drosophila suzukii]XP_036669267.1 kazrin isoform X1 [Drosophila suzukii]XP_036669268.1 kazrin isoform X1 [Drosophila suzukii]XP_036669269.1 kazrin isoform X1 [Drosophila suzukii]XP_036669270.1 kazrin isoform X1 [Drosophila suzukii]XP_036669271.1 kazrin isoform X1 [Drosophila suzukii]XP_036669272.1 kazrin isoform X1 [Drosophila suzukii]
MQINGLAAGPTMAASEPPEPPPRNPDRINASLHKLGESKIAKSLDTTVTTGLKEKSASVNNNKPIRPLLSLDSSVTASTSSGAAAGATGVAGSGSGGGGAPAKPAPLVLTSKRDLTPSNDSSSSPSSSNGSNQTLTPPMTADSQQLQHLQHRSPSYPGKGDTLPPAAAVPHQQQQQQQQQQLPNGTGSSHCNSNSNSSSTCNSGNAMIHANNSNLIAAGHLAQAAGPAHNAPSSGSALNAVDKRNANLSEPDQESSSKPKLNVNPGLSPSVALGAPHSPTSAASAALLLLESCDGNRNDESRFHHLHSANAPPRPEAAMKLREENDRLNAELLRLRRLLELSTDGAVGGVDTTPEMEAVTNSTAEGSAAKERIERLESELRSVKNQLLTMRLERKKLRTDKSDLLGQVKQLCASLQEKEQELRDFIRNYQERVRETETTNAKISGDRDRERFQLLKQARDEAERSLALAQQLSARDLQLQRLQEQLQEARRQLSGCLSDQESLHSFAPLTPPSAASGMLSQMAAASGMGGGLAGMRGTAEDSGRGNSLSAFSGSLSGGSGATAGDRNSCSNDSGLRNSSDRESTGGELNFSDGTCDNGPCITVDPDSISLVSSQNMYQFGTPKERSPTLSPLNSAAYSRSVEQLGSPVDPEGPGGGAISRKFANASKSGPLGARNGRGGTWGSISRVFARSRNKSKALSADGVTEYADYSWNPLTEEGYAEKLRLLREASQLPIDRWRATQVLAWLEVALGMPQYSARCAENVKSGKVLLELNDVELEAGLGLAHPMHRKKLRLAIEEQRRPEMVRYPLITQLGHTWVATEWLPDIGLPQYAEPFVQSLVDARMLDTLSKKELEKFLGVTRKFHQASIVHGIHVLRIVKYDRQTLAMRRVQSETVDTDPIVWTNQRFIRWVRSIDLGEYADNLKDSGVHGGLVVLEPSFSGDTMATALGIPPSKNIIRRHLNTEFDALILPARATLGQGIRSGCGVVPLTGPGGLQHYATTDRRSSGNLRISAWKGSQSSLSKAFRFNSKPHRTGDRSSFGNSTSPTPSYSSSEGGGGIYATIGHQYPNPHTNPQQHYHHFLPPPTTAPPPIPSAGGIYSHGPPPGHRVSAPPVGGVLDAGLSDPQMLYEQSRRRVKSISDIGASTSAGSVGACSLGGISASSESPE